VEIIIIMRFLTRKINLSLITILFKVHKFKDHHQKVAKLLNIFMQIVMELGIGWQKTLILTQALQMSNYLAVKFTLYQVKAPIQVP
jgi:hypothetical protein